MSFQTRQLGLVGELAGGGCVAVGDRLHVSGDTDIWHMTLDSKKKKNIGLKFYDLLFVCIFFKSWKVQTMTT